MQTGQRQKELRGRRVLVVEDEVLVALDYCQNLQDAGAEVVGPFLTVDDALNCMGKGRIDVAVLDYELADRNSDDLQNMLESREIPFVVVTAYPRVLVRRNDNQKVLSKPISRNTLCESVRAACR
ncbi:MAG: response regulator [Hyphomicrobium sp.]